MAKQRSISFHKYSTTMALVYAKPNMAFALLHKNPFRGLGKDAGKVNPDEAYWIEPLHQLTDVANFDVSMRQFATAPALKDGEGETSWFTAEEVGPVLKVLLENFLRAAEEAAIGEAERAAEARMDAGPEDYI